jgi:hypothetical protein
MHSRAPVAAIEAPAGPAAPSGLPSRKPGSAPETPTAEGAWQAGAGKTD